MKETKLTTGQLVRRMAGIVSHLKLQYVLAVTCAVLGFLTTIAIPAWLLQLTWAGLNGQAPSWLALIGLALLGLARGLFRYGEHLFGHYVAFKTLYDLRCMVFDKLRRLAPAHLDQQDSGKLLKMIGEDIEAMEVFFAHTVPPVLTATVVSIILGIYYLSVSPLLTLVAFVTYAILAVALPRFFASILQPLLAKQSQERKRYMSLFSDSLRGMKDLMQLGQADTRFALLNKASQSVNREEESVTKANHLQSALTYFVVALSILLVSVIAIRAVQAGDVQLEAAAIVIVVFTTSFAPYLELSRLPLGFKRAMNAGRDVFTLLDQEETDQSGQELVGSIDSIDFENVDFQYSSRDTVIYKDLSQSFEKGKLIGLVGPSGSGKSTMMKLLMKWYPVTAGRILINGQNLADLSAASVQEKIACVPQIPQIFSQSIRDNLTLGNPAISDEDIMTAAAKCRIADKIRATEKGLDTLLSPEQSYFSAGELQRLELTRALLKKADCYIFDEPTSNLDSLNEAAFLQVVKEECTGYTFLISHRSSTVAVCDQVFQVEGQNLYPVS